jgi:hypothetical protein
MHERKALLFIAGGVGFVLIVLAAAWMVLGKFSPEAEIRRMFAAMAQVRTVSERSAFSWTRGEGRERVTTSVYTVGHLDISDPAAVEHATKFRVFRLSRGKDYADLSGEMRTIDGTTYLTYAPPGPEVEGVDFSDETWVSFDEGELPQWGSIIPGLDAPIVGEDPSSNQRAPNVWTADGLVRLRQLLSRADVFLVRYDDLTELISGEATRVIDARFDPDALRAFLSDMVRAREGREPTDDERLAAEAQAKAIESLALRMWIGMEDHLLYRFQAAGLIPDGDGNVLIPTDMIIELSDFDAPFAGTVPKKTIAFDVLARQLLGSLEESGFRVADGGLVSDDPERLPSIAAEPNDDPDRDGLTNIVEAFYRTNPKKADTDGDGKTDSEEVLTGLNPRGTGTLFGFGLGE